MHTPRLPAQTWSHPVHACTHKHLLNHAPSPPSRHPNPHSLHATQGIGRATALLFAKKGFNVVVAARDMAKLQFVVHDCAQSAGRQGASMAVQCDVTSEEDVKKLAYAVCSKYEDVDVVGACWRGEWAHAEAGSLMGWGWGRIWTCWNNMLRQHIGSMHGRRAWAACTGGVQQVQGRRRGGRMLERAA
jgi:NAD(P)-dependent dehydrogenase (short-subunit alcohol dehydrogenase family)